MHQTSHDALLYVPSSHADEHVLAGNLVGDLYLLTGLCLLDVNSTGSHCSTDRHLAAMHPRHPHTPQLHVRSRMKIIEDASATSTVESLYFYTHTGCGYTVESL